MASELLSRLSDYGVDLSSTMERFVGNEELYQKCFDMFLSDDNMRLLAEALSRQDYEAAFNAAHTLKGITANMGFAPLLKPVSALVEALRAGDHTNLDAQYAAVAAEYEKVTKLR